MCKIFSSAGRFVLASLLSASLFCSTGFARIMDGGVDPENLGTGDWIYFLNAATNQLGGNVASVTNLTSLMEYYKSQGISFLAVKAGSGAEEFPSARNPQFTREVVEASHAAGIKIFGYTRSDGKDVPGEIKLAAKVYDLGADGFIIDAEAEWEASRLGDKGPQLAIELCEGIRSRYPNKFLAHAPFPIISKHSSFPYKEFGYYCDAVMPQDYWKSIGVSPSRMVRWMNEEWHAFHKSLRGHWTNAIKPLAPIGQGWSPTKDEVVTGNEIMEFVAALNHLPNPVTPGGYKGVSYWRTDLHTDRMWKGIRRAQVGKPRTTSASLITEDPEPVVAKKKVQVDNANDFILDDDNENVTFTGAWYPGKQKEGFHGDTYLCANAVTGDPTAKVDFRPLIRNTGYYDIYVWYRTNSKYSQRAPWTVTYKGESFTQPIDQTSKTAKWVLIAESMHISSGTNLVVSLTNDTGESSDTPVVADAVRFVRKEETQTAGQ